MRIEGDFFVRAGSKVSRKSFTGVAWPVYSDFEIERTNEDVVAYAPFDPVPLEPGRLYHGVPEHEGLKRLYVPLREMPDLFLRFASRAPKVAASEEKSLEAMLGWITTYGVLDFGDHQGRRQSLAAFTKAVKTAARCLTLYEAATAPGGPDADVLERYQRYQPPVGTLNEQREWALTAAGRVVERHVRAECYPVLYRGIRKPNMETIGFEQGWGFHSLLGAMYLQLMLYMTEGGTARKCKRPGCYNLVTFEAPQPSEDPGLRKGARGKYRTRRDKQFCSKACAQWWSDNYGNSKKAQRKRK